MSKTQRLQVLFDPEELETLREAARAEGVPLSDWVRKALRNFQRDSATDRIDEKLAAVRAAVEFEYPVSDVDQLLSEIDAGREWSAD